ncbi:MAG: hypothetical protein ACTSQG_02780 [Promethearchaeota archaeon]
MTKKTLKKVARTLIRNKITYSMINGNQGIKVSSELKKRLQCPTCKGEGYFKASTRLPQCSSCGGNGINSFKRELKGSIDELFEKLASGEATKHLKHLSIKQLEDRIQKIIGR